MKELHNALGNLGIFIPDKMIEKIDTDGDGCVNMDEFRELF